MRVKIITATGNCGYTCWYRGQIGNVLKVQPDSMHPNIMFELKDYPNLRINKSDCEVIPDQTPQFDPFDLERALKGERVITRDGREVEEIYHFQKDRSEWCIHAIIDGSAFDYLIDGTSERPYNPGEMDLFMAPKEPKMVTRWVNVYEMGNEVGDAYNTHEEAKAKVNTLNSYVGTFSFTITLP